jgi:hypothetical protein
LTKAREFQFQFTGENAGRGIQYFCFGCGGFEGEFEEV